MMIAVLDFSQIYLADEFLLHTLINKGLCLFTYYNLIKVLCILEILRYNFVMKSKSKLISLRDFISKFRFSPNQNLVQDLNARNCKELTQL